MYKQIIKPILFCFKPETSYNLYLRILKALHFIFGPHLIRLTHRFESPSLRREVFGIDFKNPIGLSAGFDVNGDYLKSLSDYGFGFIEIGSISPDPQNVYEKPRVFRLPKDRAVINRISGKNKGVKYAINNIVEGIPGTVVSANIISDAKSTKDDEMIRDYQKAFSLMYDFVDMFTVNVSLPNESGVHAIQDKSSLSEVVDPLLDLRLCYDTYKPILIKVSPDIPYEQLDGMLDYCMMSGVDGVIAGGLTGKREGLSYKAKKLNSIGKGGLSGAPLYNTSLSLVKYIYEYTKGRFPIIGCGGIMSPEQAYEMLSAGASLIQMNTGILYEGPGLVKKSLKHIASKQS